MKAINLISPASYSRKILALYFLMLVDIYMSTHLGYVDFSEDLWEEGAPEFDEQNEKTAGYLVLGLHFVVQIAIFFWFFFLIWKTFLFRFGLLGVLLKNNPGFFILLPLNLIFFIAEKIYRIVTVVVKSGSEDCISIWGAWFYIIIFWARNLVMVFFYGFTIKASLDLGNASYYQPHHKWLTPK